MFDSFVRSRNAMPAAAAAAALAALCLGPATGASTAGTVAPEGGADALDGLTLRQLAGQKLIVGYDGTRVPARITDRIRRGEVGGIILFARNVGSRPALRAEMRRLQSIRRPVRAPLLVMIDQEGGLVKRLNGAPSLSPAALGRIGSATRVRREGRATAANLKDAGVNVNLAPVVDVGRNGSYQQRTGRSYSTRAGTVASLGTAFVRGMEERGVAATLKHFPGLGPVRRNEDDIVQTVGLPLATLRSVDERPFAAGIAAGVDLIMTSTARYPGLSSRPALLSHRISTAELRGRLGYRGVAITDDLDVVALRSYGGARALAVEAAKAGNDLLLFAQSAGNGAAALDALTDAVQAGRIDRADLRAGVSRVVELRERL